MNVLRLPLLFLLLLSSGAGAAKVSKRHHDPPPPPSSDFTGSAPLPILLACNATLFKPLCASSLSSSTFTSADDIVGAAISLAGEKLPSFSAAASNILSMSKASVNRTNAAKNCLELLSVASHRLAAARASSDVAYARLLVGTALLHQYDCWSAYKYVNDTSAVAAAMADLNSNIMLASNAAAMLFSLQRFGNDTGRWGPPVTERHGYWPPSGSAAPKDIDQYGVPKDLPANVTVCTAANAKGGDGCDFPTVQSAVSAAPDKGTAWFVVRVREGVYEETVTVGFEKTNVVLIGDGIGKTIITGSLNADTPGVSTYNTATVAVFGDGFMARDLTIANTAGPNRHQAVALRTTSDRTVVDTVELLGHQDTLYAHAMRQLFTRCRISGTVDFIFGNSAAVIHNSEITVLPRQVNPEAGEKDAVTAHGRTDPSQPTGLVLHRCTINGSEDYLKLYRRKPAVHKVYLGRPWKQYARTVYVSCTMAEIVRPEGWMPFDGNLGLSTLFYGEYGSSGPGGAAGRRVTWSSQVPAEHVEAYSVENFVQGHMWAPNTAQ